MPPRTGNFRKPPNDPQALIGFHPAAMIEARLDPPRDAEAQLDFFIFVEAGDLLFPSGGYELSPAGKTSSATTSSPSSRDCRTPRSLSTAIPTAHRLARS